MTPELALFVPSIPMPVLLGVTAVTAVALMLVMVRLRDRTGAFVVGAAWLRYTMSAFHAFTFRPLVAGMSGNALGSIFVFLLGLVFVRRRSFLLRFLLPFYILVALAIFSGLINRQFSGLITVLIKYGYLIVMVLAVYEALSRLQEGRLMRALLWAFAPPLICQALSVVMGISKQTEIGGSTAYIGGYNHEAAFSITLMTCFVVACFTEKMSKVLKNGLIIACIAGIFLANYRTTLLAMAPLAVMYFGFSSISRFPTKERPLIVGAGLILASIGLGVASLFLADRFQDMGVAFSGDVNFFKPANEYTVEETRIFSGRPYIWMGYIFAYFDGSPAQHWIGFGPEAWEGLFRLYAHNTMVSYLYEYGILGVAALLYLWLSMLAAALRVRHPHKGLVVGAHMSFLLLNMSTMPMWLIEGNILYAIICGYTMHLLRAPQTRPAGAQPRTIRRRLFAAAPVRPS